MVTAQVLVCTGFATTAVSEHQYSILTHIYGTLKDGNNNPEYETAKETLRYRRVLWTLWEREKVGRFGRMALKHVKYHV